MKKLLVSIFIILCFASVAIAETYEVGIYATNDRAGSMSFSGTSTCPVIDTKNMRFIDNGRFTFHFVSLGGTTSVPVSGTTVSVHWRGAGVNTASAWDSAAKNTFIDGINAFSGNTNIGYDLNDYGSGVTPFRYIRLEFESGVSADTGGAGNLKPLGVLFIR